MLVQREYLQAHWKTVYAALTRGIHDCKAQGLFSGQIILVLCDLFQGAHVAFAWATLLKYYFTRCNIPVTIVPAAVGTAARGRPRYRRGQRGKCRQACSRLAGRRRGANHSQPRQRDELG